MDFNFILQYMPSMHFLTDFFTPTPKTLCVSFTFLHVLANSKYKLIQAVQVLKIARDPCSISHSDTAGEIA